VNLFADLAGGLSGHAGQSHGGVAESLPIPDASSALSRLDGFAPTPTDREDAAPPFLQLLGSS
jgi:hypothetical protein